MQWDQCWWVLENYEDTESTLISLRKSTHNRVRGWQSGPALRYRRLLLGCLYLTVLVLVTGALHIEMEQIHPKQIHCHCSGGGSISVLILNQSLSKLAHSEQQTLLSCPRLSIRHIWLGLRSVVFSFCLTLLDQQLALCQSSVVDFATFRIWYVWPFTLRTAALFFFVKALALRYICSPLFIHELYRASASFVSRSFVAGRELHL